MPIAVAALAVIDPSIVPVVVALPIAPKTSWPSWVNEPDAPTNRPVPPLIVKFLVAANVPGVAVASARPAKLPVMLSPPRKAMVNRPSTMSGAAS